MNVAARTWVVSAILLAIFLAGGLPSAQGQDGAPSLLEEVNRLLKDQKVDEAVVLVRAKAASETPAADVPAAMYRVARHLSVQRRDVDYASLALWTELTTRFPDSPWAALAWCSIGQNYGRRGEHDKMIDALERGLLGPPAAAVTSAMAFDFAHGFACETLGKHYLKLGEWEKALRVLTDWKPSSGCGTCDDFMQARRATGMRYCQVQLGRFDEAVVSAWRDVGVVGFGGDRMADFVLVRLYAEAGQLEDLERMNLKLVEEAARQFPTDGPPTNAYWLRAIIKTSSSLSDAVERVRRKSLDDALDRIASEQRVSRLDRHVASWMLMQQPRWAVELCERAVLRKDGNAEASLEILAAIDTPEAREAMVRLATGDDIGLQQMVCGLIRHRMKDPQPLIDEIVARVPSERARYTNWNLDPAPFTARYYESWTPPAAGSLPKELPAGLFPADPR